MSDKRRINIPNDNPEYAKIAEILDDMWGHDRWEIYDYHRNRILNCNMNAVLRLVLNDNIFVEDRAALASVLLEAVGKGTANEVEKEAMDVLQHSSRLVRLGTIDGLIYAERKDLLKDALEKESDPVICREIKDALQ